MAFDLLCSIEASMCSAQALAFERLLLVVKTQPITSNPPPRPRISDLRPVNENIPVTHRDRPSDAHQRVPLEPLFHIDTEAQPAAQPMSIDEASEMHSEEEKAQTFAANGNSHAAANNPAAQSDVQHDAKAGAVKPEVSSSVKIEDAGQVAAPVNTRQHLCMCLLAGGQRMLHRSCTPAFVCVYSHVYTCYRSILLAWNCWGNNSSTSTEMASSLFQSRLLGCNLQADTVLGQSKAGLLNRVHALEEANVPANSAEVMKVDAS